MNTPQQLIEMQMRLARSRKKPVGETVKQSGVNLERESDLHEKIESELKLRRFYYVSSRMDKRTTTQKGVCDYIVAIPNGITLWVEAKTRTGKLSEHQTITKHVLLGLSHRHGVVRSFDEFLDFLKLHEFKPAFLPDKQS